MNWEDFNFFDSVLIIKVFFYREVERMIGSEVVAEIGANQPYDDAA